MLAAKALADQYLRSAGIAAICINPDGHVAAYGTVGIDLPANLVCFACLRRDIERLAAHAQRCRGDQAAVAAQLEQLAADLYIGLSRHSEVVAWAMHAVAVVHRRIREMQSNGGMKAVNAAFKAARTVAPSLRYRDHLDAFKLKLIDETAQMA